MTTLKRTPWQGTDYIERRLLLVNNRLSYVIVPSLGPLQPERDIEALREAEDTRDWLATQRAPTARSRRWAEYELQRLDRSIARAKERLRETGHARTR